MNLLKRFTKLVRGNSKKGVKSRYKPQRARLGVESLERREVLSTFVWSKRELDSRVRQAAKGSAAGVRVGASQARQSLSRLCVVAISFHSA